VDHAKGRRARSFGLRPVEYHTHRPDYPADAIRWGLAAGTRGVLRALDLAAGTGKLTAGLLGLGLEVTAVEPDDAMRAVFAREFPHVSALPGTAERIPLPDASVDAVLVGQAFHWFDPVPALTEIARVLAPGGALAVLWNSEDFSHAWVGALVETSRTSATPGWQGELEPPAHDDFTDAERTVLPNTLRGAQVSYPGYVGTQSRMLVIEDEERAQVVARVEEFLRDHARAVGEGFDLPMVTEVLRMRRH
jgi:SAM-dependent methyltransferase